MKTTVTVISAANLVSQSEDSTMICPFVRILGHSVEDYLIGETTTVNNSNNPQFKESFTFDFFVAAYLDFCVYNHSTFSRDELIGISRIHVSDIIPEGTMKLPINCVRSGSIISDLTVRFEYNFSPIIKGTQGILQKQIFLFTTYQSMPRSLNPVDIECLIVDHKWKMFYKLDSGNWWTTVGRSSNEETVPVGDGYSQLRKIDVNKIKDCEVHFFIKSNNYTGKLFLNFACNCKKDLSKVKVSPQDLTLFKQIEFDVTPGNYCPSPEKMLVKFLGKVDFTYEDSSDYDSLINYLANGLKMTRRYILPHNRPTSLSGHSNISIVFGGSVFSENGDTEVDPRLYSFDVTDKSFLGGINEMDNNKSLLGSSVVYEGINRNYVNNNLNGNTKYVDSESISINLDEISHKHQLIVGVKTPPDLSLREIEHPMVRIVDIDQNKELFFLPFKPYIYEASGELLFRIVFQNENWEIVPIFQPVMQGNHLKNAAVYYVNHDCPSYSEFDLKVKPLIQNKGFELQKENNEVA